MELVQIIYIIYPELKDVPLNCFNNYPFVLQNDSDGKGTYIKEWNYEKPKPTIKQLKAVETIYTLNPELLSNQP